NLVALNTNSILGAPSLPVAQNIGCIL
ncbi:uncharacterized protein METZ01_LOCUS161937, partial [marine metagenome]